MTLLLETKSHGTIESGFYSTFTQMARIGQYAFETKDLCYLAKALAENPKLRNLEISGCNLDQYRQLEKTYRNSIIENANSEDAFEEFMEKAQGNLPLESKAELVDVRKAVPIRVGDESIKVGEYVIKNDEFALMMHYFVEGGFVGWLEKEPTFVAPVILAIQMSKNPLFKSISNSFSV